MKKNVNVAAAIITREDGSFLLGQRAADTFYPGYWEFPGGKVEEGESPEQALKRELKEELGIEINKPLPWLIREHSYEHAHVRLHFFLVNNWQGEMKPHVHTGLAWQRADCLTVNPMLPANAPILKALRLPSIMAVTDAERIGYTRQLELIESAFKGGLSFIQIRATQIPDEQSKEPYFEFITRACALATKYEAICVINAPLLQLFPQLSAQANGIHLKAIDLMQCTARPEYSWVGASCHTIAELQHAQSLGLDYVVLGPVFSTATHPEQNGVGWEKFSQLLNHCRQMPIFAIGGLGANDLSHAQSLGAHGIAGIRQIWEQE